RTGYAVLDRELDTPYLVGLDTPYSTVDHNRTAFRFHPFQFTYPERKLTIEEIVYKFIDEGKREDEGIRAFIREFRTSNELLFKERNNSLSELSFEVHGLSRVIDNTLISNSKVNGVTKEK
ncbi:hypothetical protein Tco_1466207, partial [Tanacetum coccineum]